jgi:hypothetical protein
MKQKFQQFLDQMKEQEWYQQIQSSYQQLSPEQQSYVKWGSILATVAVFFSFTLKIMKESNTIKGEYFQKQELVQMLNQGSDEVRRLKGQSSGFGQSGQSNWKNILQNLVSSQGLQPDSIEILKEAPGAAKNVIQETLLEVQVKGVTVRPLVQILFQLEHSQPPMKLKGMSIESGASDGQLNAKLNLSAYMAKGEKTK